MINVDRDQILRLFAYHHWAGDRLFDAFADVAAAQLDRAWGGSFATGRGLLRHIVGADRVWVTRWNGTFPKAFPDFPLTYAGSDFQGEWSKVTTDQKRFLGALKTEQLNRPFTYVNLRGEPWTYRLADVLVHVVNHGTYHRGQLTHLLRDFGLSPPSTDYLMFAEGTRIQT